MMFWKEEIQQDGERALIHDLLIHVAAILSSTCLPSGQGEAVTLHDC